MPAFENPLEWARAISLHVQETGHGLYSDDSLFEKTIGFSCLSCEKSWSIHLAQIHYYEPAEGSVRERAGLQALRESIKTSEGKRRLLHALMTKSPFPLPKTRFDREDPV